MAMKCCTKLETAKERCPIVFLGPKFEITDGYEMMHKAWSSIEEVPYCFSRSYVKLQGHTAQKIIDFDPN